MKKIAFVGCIMITLQSIAAEAYVGPGVGAGTIGIVLGILGSVFLAFFAIIWYPLKRILRKKKAARARTSDGAEKAEVSGDNTQLDDDRPFTRPTQNTGKN